MTPLTPKSAVKIQNDSGEEIPPHSVVVVTSVEIVPATSMNEAYSLCHIEKYAAQRGNILVTGGLRIKAGETGTGGWSEDKSFGYAYADPTIYVSIDDAVDVPVQGEQWGPISGQWHLSRKGAGFFAMKFPASDIANGFGLKRAMFMRSAPAPRWGKLASSMSAGSLASPTSTTVDIWEKNYASGSSPKAYAVSTHSELLALTVANHWNISETTGRGVHLIFKDNEWCIVGVDCA